MRSVFSPPEQKCAPRFSRNDPARRRRPPSTWWSARATRVHARSSTSFHLVCTCCRRSNAHECMFCRWRRRSAACRCADPSRRASGCYSAEPRREADERKHVRCRPVARRACARLLRRLCALSRGSGAGVCAAGGHGGPSPSSWASSGGSSGGSSDGTPSARTRSNARDPPTEPARRRMSVLSSLPSGDPFVPCWCWQARETPLSHAA